MGVNRILAVVLLSCMVFYLHATDYDPNVCECGKGALSDGTTTDGCGDWGSFSNWCYLKGKPTKGSLSAECYTKAKPKWSSITKQYYSEKLCDGGKTYKWGAPILSGGNEGRCGERYKADCSTSDKVEGWDEVTPCCSAGGWCGSANGHCKCMSCVDFRKYAKSGTTVATTETDVEPISTTAASTTAVTCSKPAIDNADISPSDASVKAEGMWQKAGVYTITCRTGFRLVGSNKMKCKNDGSFDQIPQCKVMNQACTDTSLKCVGWKSFCGITSYFDKLCLKTCDKCESAESNNCQPKPDERKMRHICPRFKKNCTSSEKYLKAFMKKNCATTCNLC